MSDKKTYFVDVIIPLALAQLYTYRVPFELNDYVKVGCRAIAQFGKNKYYSVLIAAVHENPPKNYTAKYIESVIDEHPVVNHYQLDLWQWMSSYYMCSIGEMMVAAMPSGLKLSSETQLIKNTSAIIDDKHLSDEEFIIAQALDIRNVITFEDVQEIIGRKSIHHLVRSLMEKNVLLVHEDIKQKYKPKLKSFVRLTKQAESEEALKEILNTLEKKSAKQADLLMMYLKLSNNYSHSENKLPVTKADLLKQAESTDAVLNGLIKKNILEVFTEETDRIYFEGTIQDSYTLNIEQTEILKDINKIFDEKNVALLHGVTSSGKTEVYIKLIEQVIERGEQVLYLLPEIALTSQIINRLQKHFGDKVGVYHSRYNENERVEVWNKVLNFSHQSQEKIKSQIIVGARSALFLPFSKLGLVIVDEEHDASYKQYDPAPRYHARDAAIYLSHLHKAKTLLGSATPSLESYYNANIGKYGFVELLNRYGGVKMPEIILVDIKELQKRKEMKSHFAPQMIEAIGDALKQKEQVIVFQNRRGFSTMLTCQTCDWIPQCTQCDVSLTYYKSSNQLKCHYCGYSLKTPTACAACGGDSLKLVGFGTEKIEEELSIFFPEAKIARMDLDTTRAKHSHSKIIADFEDRNIDILVGTQMVTKGLDFDNVSLVGVMNADAMLNFPDFRSFEKSFQQLAQVSGRAGRKSKRGKVLIQTGQPHHDVLSTVITHDYKSFYESEIEQRKQFDYPPFFRLIEITLQHKDIDYLNEAANELASELKVIYDEKILGPAVPIIGRIKNYYLKSILVKIDKSDSVSSFKQTILKISSGIKNKSEFKQLRIIFDVDPV